MRIGLDIDNVILNTDEVLLEEFLKEDKNKRNRGIIDKNAPYIMMGMFDWTKDEINKFLNNNMEDFAKNLIPLENAKKYMDMLLDEGHELYLVSNRAYPQYKNPLEITKNNLEKNNINYTKLILTETNDKLEEVLKEKIDIFIDDRFSNLKILMNYDIPCILFKTKYENRIFKEIDTVNNWHELYQKIKEIKL